MRVRSIWSMADVNLKERMPELAPRVDLFCFASVWCWTFLLTVRTGLGPFANCARKVSQRSLGGGRCCCARLNPEIACNAETGLIKVRRPTTEGAMVVRDRSRRREESDGDISHSAMELWSSSAAVVRVGYGTGR